MTEHDDVFSAEGENLPAEPLRVHEFEHRADGRRQGQRRALGWALALKIALLLAEVAGGIAFGSLALLADAAHIVSDIAGIAIALGAMILTSRPVSSRHSFGFSRAEVLAAQVSALLLLAAGASILFASVARLRDPVAVDGAGLAAVAGVGLLVNLGSALLVHRAQGESLSMRASFVHLATDAAGSLGAVLAGLMIVAWGWQRADSVASLVIAVLVVWSGGRILRDTTHVLMEGTPRSMDTDRVRTAMLGVAGVADIHHLHLWNLASDVPALSAHVVVAGDPRLRDAQQTADQVRAILTDRFGLTHMTLEIESTPVGQSAPDRPSTPG